MATHSFKDLVVWQKSMQLTKAIYQLCTLLPKHELYGLSDQLRRAAVSIPSNIAEGQKRLHKTEFAQFVSVALGSVAELETQLILVQELYGITTQAEQDQCAETAKMLTALLMKLRSKN